MRSKPSTIRINKSNGNTTPFDPTSLVPSCILAWNIEFDASAFESVRL
jgi:hypothetical protein